MLNGGRRSYPVLGGRLHFVKFETGKLNECLDFISSKQLHRGGVDSPSWRSGAQPDNIVIKVTNNETAPFRFMKVCLVNVLINVCYCSLALEYLDSNPLFSIYLVLLV